MELTLLQELKKPNGNASEEAELAEVRFYEGRGTAAGKLIVVIENRRDRKVEDQARVALDVCGVALERIVFIEHCEKNARFEETFDLVHFKEGLREPNWSPLKKSSVTRFKGRELKFKTNRGKAEIRVKSPK